MTRLDRHPVTRIAWVSAVMAFLVLATAGQALAVSPTITSFTPTSGPAGCVVSISGTNFTSPLVSAVDFDGTPAAIGLVTGTEIRATVPGGASSGPIRVTNGDGTATSSNCSVNDPGACAPTVTSFDPTSGPSARR